MPQDPTGGFGFPKSRRLRRRREYLEVQGGRSRDARAPGAAGGAERQRRRAGRFVVFLRRCADGRPGRLGITVPAGVGNAVRRNRIRRLVREAYRTVTGLFPEGHDVVVLAISGEGEWSLERVVEELSRWKRPR